MMTNLRQVLASNIRGCRNSLGLSQAKLADRVDSAANYIAAIEAGRKFPSVEMIEKLAAALEIDTLELFSSKPLGAAAIKRLQKDILLDIEKLIEGCIAERLTKLKEHP
jgi:transcriptional regulator with XRE-family HTH domain